MQQHLGSLHISNILDKNSMIRKLLGLQPIVNIAKLLKVRSAQNTTFSCDSHTSSGEAYGQIGMLSDLKVMAGDQIIYYPIMRTSSKQKRPAIHHSKLKYCHCRSRRQRPFTRKKTFFSFFPDGLLQQKQLVDSKSLSKQLQIYTKLKTIICVN